jgi:hypothetical protein
MDELDDYQKSMIADLLRDYIKGLKGGDISVGNAEATVEEIESAEDALAKLER